MINRKRQDVNAVLAQFGGREKAAKESCRRFVAEGIKLGRRPELVGGGFDPMGGSEVKNRRRDKEREAYDERILGSGEFVERINRESEGDARRL